MSIAHSPLHSTNGTRRGASSVDGHDRPVTTLAIVGLGQGGAQTQLVALACYLKSSGWDIDIVALLPSTRFVAELQASGIPLWCGGMSRRRLSLAGVRALIKLWRHLRARRPDVLCTFLFHANVLGKIFGRMAGIPVVVSSIRNERFGPPWREWLEAKTQALSAVTVVNAESVAASLAGKGIVARDRCRVIPNAVDTAQFSGRNHVRRHTTRAALGIPADVFVWLAIGRLEPQKDYPALLRALASVRARHRTVRLIVAGDGRLRESLQRLSGELRLDDAVSWLGFRRDVLDLLAASDALVLASRWEGSPNVVLEAFAAGLPVAATDVGGVRELVQNGRSGFIVQPGDVGALSTVMDRIMALTPPDREQMGERGRKFVRERHDATRVLEQWRQLLSDAWRSTCR